MERVLCGQEAAQSSPWAGLLCKAESSSEAKFRGMGKPGVRIPHQGGIRREGAGAGGMGKAKGEPHSAVS